MEKMTKEVNWKCLIKILIICLVYLVIYFAPYTLDDWAWGTDTGMNRLKAGFRGYNGRWISNILVILLTRSRILKTIVTGTIILIIVKLMNKLVDSKSKSLAYMISILLLLMPYKMFAQTMTWTSGFTNYVVPIALLLLYLLINKNIFEEKIKNRKIYIIPMIIFGFIISLFMENITIYNLILGIFLLFCELFRKKKLNLTNLGYVIGSIAGAILMFSNTAYTNIVAKGTDGFYRSLETQNIIFQVISKYFSTIYSHVIRNNLVIMLVLSALSILLIYKYFKKNKKISNIKKDLLQISLAIIITYVVYLIFMCVGNSHNIFISSVIKKIIEGLMSAFFALAIICTLFITIEDKNKKIKILFYIVSIVLMVAPLFLVTPISERMFYCIYVFFILIACEIITYLFKEKTIINSENILIFITLILIIFYTIIFGSIYRIETIRDNYIEEIKDTQEEYVILPKLPLSQYLKSATPKEELWFQRFKKFYNIKNKKTVLIFVSYDEWKLYKDIDVDALMDKYIDTQDVVIDK